MLKLGGEQLRGLKVLTLTRTRTRTRTLTLTLSLTSTLTLTRTLTKVHGLPTVQLSAARVAECVACRSMAPQPPLLCSHSTPHAPQRPHSRPSSRCHRLARCDLSGLPTHLPSSLADPPALLPG